MQMKILKMLGLHVSFPISNEVAIHVLTQGKKAVFFKVFKLPGKKCTTTVSKENFEKK